MIVRPEERILVSALRCRTARVFPVRLVFLQDRMLKLERLPVSLLDRPDPVQESRSAGNPANPGQPVQENRGPQGRRNIQVRDTPHPQCLDGTEGFADNKVGLQFLRPADNLGTSQFRIEVVSPDDNVDVLPCKVLLQQARYPAVTASAHAVDV